MNNILENLQIPVRVVLSTFNKVTDKSELIVNPDNMRVLLVDICKIESVTNLVEWNIRIFKDKCADEYAILKEKAVKKLDEISNEKDEYNIQFKLSTTKCRRYKSFIPVLSIIKLIDDPNYYYIMESFAGIHATIGRKLMSYYITENNNRIGRKFYDPKNKLYGAFTFYKNDPYFRELWRSMDKEECFAYDVRAESGDLTVENMGVIFDYESTFILPFKLPDNILNKDTSDVEFYIDGVFKDRPDLYLRYVNIIKLGIDFRTKYSNKK